MGKAFYLSKTFWLNVLAIVALILQSYTEFVLSPEAQVAILGLINLILRAVTNEPLSWGNQTGRLAPPLVLHLLMACLALGLLVSSLPGCAITQQSHASIAAKSLLAAQAVTVGLAEAADAMCTAGTLNQGQCDQFGEIYGQARASYDLATELLIVAIESGDSEESAAWANYQVVNARFFDITTSMQAIATEFGIVSATGESDQ
ncbi:MAG: hypothetical protein AB7D06_17165 [Pedobacter sp.]